MNLKEQLLLEVTNIYEFLWVKFCHIKAHIKFCLYYADFHDLSNLEYLTMDYSNNLKNEFFKSIGELTSLKDLSLCDCDINGTLPPTGNYII